MDFHACQDVITLHKETHLNSPIHTLALEITEPETDPIKRTRLLTDWLFDELEWVATDYEQRTVDEILLRGAGNCAEQANVLDALLVSIGVSTRWIAEINIHPPSKRRQCDAEDLFDTYGSKASVFGYQHNDHRWLEVYDESIESWRPADPTLGIVGEHEWVRDRISFTDRPELGREMIVPFSVFTVSPERQPQEDRSRHYLLDVFNEYYGERLTSLSHWSEWEDDVAWLSRLGRQAYAGEINLHEYAGSIEELLNCYQQLGQDWESTAHSQEPQQQVTVPRNS